jgi:hemolysin type calcium-binding protein
VSVETPSGVGLGELRRTAQAKFAEHLFYALGRIRLADAEELCLEYHEQCVICPAMEAGRRTRMRRTFKVLIVMVTTLVAASRIARAVVRNGGPGNDTLIGTNAGDNMEGKADDDTLMGLAGRDWLIGGGGKDTLLGMPTGTSSGEGPPPPTCTAGRVTTSCLATNLFLRF